MGYMGILLILIYPKPCSIYRRGTIGFREMGIWVLYIYICTYRIQGLYGVQNEGFGVSGEIQLPVSLHKARIRAMWGDCPSEIIVLASHAGAKFSRIGCRELGVLGHGA